ncbi:MAG: hypothetical protein SV186_00765 [Candidatus Nanohaloarchaea archaeon]|nr:hypothetical protein [Candidatus Nanohaloarchaea archaeon]
MGIIGSITGFIGCGLVTTVMNLFTSITTGLLGSFGGGSIGGFLLPGILLLILFQFSKGHAILLTLIFGISIAMCGASPI